MIETFKSLMLRWFSRGKIPDFIIIGVTKTGTTYLWSLLKKHPDIEMSPNFSEMRGGEINTKEIAFFNSPEKLVRGVAWYRSLFNNNKKLQGEATPSYFYNNTCHKEMRALAPNAKLIVMFRNPVTRAYSNFNHMKQAGSVWSNEPYDLSKGFEDNYMVDIENGFESGFGVMGRGLYINNLEHLLQYFPRNQILILITEQMKANPEKTWKQVCDFLDVQTVPANFTERVHVRTYEKPLDNPVAQKLYELYEPYNQRLYTFLGHSIPEWEAEKAECFKNVTAID